jgi:hypothetical protein
MKKKSMGLASLAGVYAVSAISSLAAAVPGQITPVAVYTDTHNAFGLAYDIGNNLMWFSQGDSGDDLAHSFKPFKNYTAAEIAAMPLLNGIPQVTPATALQDVAGTTAVAGSGGSGSGVHFSELAYDAVTGQLVADGNGHLKSFDPFTGLNYNSDYRPGTSNNGFADGLDVDSGTVWFSPDAQNIYKDGVLFASTGNAAQKVPGGQSGGWSGVEQVGNDVFAVAVLNFADAPGSRTIVKFDLAGNLIGFDPDGDITAARWEGLAFDGTYLYAADLRGNEDRAGVIGDIYVFAATGGIEIVPPPTGGGGNNGGGDMTPVPEVGTLAATGLFAVVSGWTFLRRRRS